MAKQRASTQRYLPIKEIRDGVIILKSGGYRTVLMVNAINFNLKSRDEQEALMANYQSFLNSLAFPIQIVVQSRTIDLDTYIKSLESQADKQSNSLLKTQTTEYVGFIRELIGVANIMSKTFYVVIPFETGPIAEGFFSKLFGGKRTPTALTSAFEKRKSELLERTRLVSGGLASLGLSNVQLNTQELVELFYTSYNPDTARRQKLFSVSNVDISFIQRLQDDQS
jgi:hypothetical protein